jgi:hypothetical protein
LWNIQKSLKYILVNFTPSLFCFLSATSILRIASKSLVVPCSLISIYFRHLHPPPPFIYILTTPTDTKPQTRPVLLSSSLFLKKDIFLCL